MLYEALYKSLIACISATDRDIKDRNIK